jgi:AcrR family transcriptional regulator
MQGAFDQFRLPPGRHGLPDSHVRENQRWRLLGACAEIIAARGSRALSLRAVTKEAAVSKHTFYEHFENLGDCVTETYAMAVESVFAAAARGCERAPVDDVRPRFGLEAITSLFREEPALAYVLADAALLDLPGVHLERARLAERLAAALASATYGEAAGNRKLGRRLSLHRVRATLGCMSLWLIEGTPMAIGHAVPELSRLLQD